MPNAQGQIPETLQGDKTEASTKEYKNKWRPNGDFLSLESDCTKECKPTQPERESLCPTLGCATAMATPTYTYTMCVPLQLELC